MQSKLLLAAGYSLLVTILLIGPLNLTLAESQHFKSEELTGEVVFSSTDGNFKLTFPALKYQEPMDVYLFHLPNSHILDKVNALTDIYYYYIYSSEVNQDSEFTLTIAYNEDQQNGKTVYYLNPQTKAYQLASARAFINNLTFKLKGKENKLVIAGTNLAESLDLGGEKVKASATYNFNVNPSLSDLKSQEVCLPYLSSYLTVNDPQTAEVKKLQTFLRELEGFSELPSTGYYGLLTYNAVVKFQEKYAQDILSPWEISQGTGRVKRTTLAKINELYCQKNKDNYVYEITIPYQIAGKRAKAAYYQFKPADDKTKWQRMESYDNVKSQAVVAVTSETEAQIALFEENDALVGLASWYAFKGGDYAASRDFAKGTKLRITNQSNGQNRGQAVVVTINDYGPRLETGRIIDLDKAAFDKIADLKTGVVPVKIEVINE